MEYLGKTIKQIRLRILILTFSIQSVLWFGSWWLYQSNFITALELGFLFIIFTMLSAVLTAWAAGYLARIPLAAMGHLILHISPSENAPAPQTDNLQIGREYITNLAYQLYQVASLQDNKILAEHKREATQASNILGHLPLPLFVFNKQQIVTFASDSALDYCRLESAQLFGKALFEAVDLDFPNDFTLENWINDCQQNKATDSAYWQRVRLHLKDDTDTIRQFDMTGYYNRDNPKGIEFIVTIFDRTKEYAQDDQSLNFIAMGVHELRTPLTLMRGYIEVFEDELADKLDPEMTEFMHRMQSASKQLSTFVNNILNLAKIEENQLSIKLTEQHWGEVIKQAGRDMELRARPLGKNIIYELSTDLPTVAVDRVTIYEVLCNILDNAIKYSGDSKDIIIKAYKSKSGLIETTIEDKGVGIPENVIPNLFEKFHRNHHNKTQISGTGLGLYLSKAIINAHTGDIWIKSKEGEGTTIGFTLQPFASAATELQNTNNKDALVRTAHGWIKNHSLYRR